MYLWTHCIWFINIILILDSVHCTEDPCGACCHVSWFLPISFRTKEIQIRKNTIRIPVIIQVTLHSQTNIHIQDTLHTMIQSLYQQKGHNYSKNRIPARNVMQDSYSYVNCLVLSQPLILQGTYLNIHQYFGEFIAKCTRVSFLLVWRIWMGETRCRDRHTSLVGEGNWNRCLIYNLCDNADNTLNTQHSFHIMVHKRCWQKTKDRNPQNIY